MINDPRAGYGAGLGQQPQQATQYDPNQLASYFDALARNNSHAERQSLAAQELAHAEALRSAPLPEGRQVGGIYRAANPLEMLAGGVNHYQGEQGVQAAMQQQHANLDQNTQDLRTQAPMIYGGQVSNEDALRQALTLLLRKQQ